MQGSPNDFWGKLKSNENGITTEWHPLAAHCADVAAVLKTLLEETVLNRRLAHIINQSVLSPIQVSRLSYLAALHDAGKVNNGFQSRAFRQKDQRTGHVSPFVAFLNTHDPLRNEIVQAIDLPSIMGWFGSEQNLINFLMASFAHHGQPVDPYSLSFNPALWRAGSRRGPLNGLRQLSESAHRWFTDAFASDEASFPPNNELQHAFNGLMILADWIASDEHFFPFADSLDDRFPDARKFAANAVDGLGLITQAARRNLRLCEVGLHVVASGKLQPRPVQDDIRTLSVSDYGSLSILESDTGSGKTEAALIRFTDLFRAGCVDYPGHESRTR